ncbi:MULTISPECIES: type II toxin-antitoxin system RelE/ParE family toxin [unclassified Maridesulfovibrio]|uniref:type II toxin-antitoxin system RelE/ParE family toxin n=1 Tax=unclassified Maridesulfovibrio TaxID=2794999 RepID=UPI003B3E7DA5
MEHALCFNHLSVDAEKTKDEAYDLAFQMFQGALELNQGEDSYSLYAEAACKEECKLTNNYSLENFSASLLEKGERDFALFIEHCANRCPCIDHLDEKFEELSQITISIRDLPPNNYDILGISWLLDGVTISLETEDRWSKPSFSVDLIMDECAAPNIVKLKNISNIIHGEIHADSTIIPPLKDICPSALFTENFIEREENFQLQQRKAIRDKLELAESLSFGGGRPLIDTLNGSKHSNLKEIRVGGQIRILFARQQDRTPAILHIFFKHGKEKEYDSEIIIADNLLDSLTKKNRK